MGASIEQNQGASTQLKTLVVKFGGTSVGSLERIHATARRVADLAPTCERLVVVVSAMSGQTDQLLKMGRSVNTGASAEVLREMDSLVATGEQVSAALLALALQNLGLRARSFTAQQANILTDGRFQRARIRSIESQSLLEALEQGQIVVLAGFQGTDDHGNVVTLGRGGSDTSAVAAAIALEADLCEIYTDVDGVYTADPRMVPGARKIPEISYDEMLELASTGAKVLMIRSVELAMKRGLRLAVRTSFSHAPGTLIKPMNDNLEEPAVTGLSHALRQAKVNILGLPDSSDSLATALEPLAQDDISVDFITQNVGTDGRMSLAFTIEEAMLDQAVASLQARLQRGPSSGITLQVDRDLAKVSVVGIGMRTHAGIAHRVFACLTRQRIPIHMALSTEIRVSCLIPSGDCERALQALHAEFFP